MFDFGFKNYRDFQETEPWAQLFEGQLALNLG